MRIFQYVNNAFRCTSLINISDSKKYFFLSVSLTLKNLFIKIKIEKIRRWILYDFYDLIIH